jgi:FkbM family methyltransferase
MGTKRPTFSLQGRPLLEIGGNTFEPASIALHAPPAPRPVHLRVGGSDMSVFHQVFGRLDYAMELPRTPKHIVDLGANIGLAAAYFAGRFPTAEIVCVEPDEGNFRMLQTNIEGYGRISALHAAVWPEPGVLQIVDSTDEGAPLKSWSIQVRPVQAGGEGPGAGRHIPALTIPDIMERAGFPRIDLLKVDVEGSELELFSRQADAWIERVDMLVIETHDKIKPGCEAAVESAVAGRGFRRSRSGENIVFVRDC